MNKTGKTQGDLFLKFLKELEGLPPDVAMVSKEMFTDRNEVERRYAAVFVSDGEGGVWGIRAMHYPDATALAKALQYPNGEGKSV